MPTIFVKEKNTTVRFPDGTAPDVMEKAIRETFFSPEEQGKMTTFGEREKYRLDKGQSTVDVGGMYWKALKGETTIDKAKAFETKRIKNFTPENDIRFAAQNTAEKFVGATTELAPYMMSSIAEGINYGNQFGAAAAAAAIIGGAAGPQAVVPEEIITVPLAFIGGKAIGQAYGAWNNAARIEGGNLFGTLVKEGVDPKTASKWAIPAGYLIGAIELLQVGQIVNKIPGAKNLTKKAVTGFIAKAITKGTESGGIKRLLATAAKIVANLIKTTALEVAEEDVQELVQIVAEVVAAY